MISASNTPYGVVGSPTTPLQVEQENTIKVFLALLDLRKRSARNWRKSTTTAEDSGTLPRGKSVAAKLLGKEKRIGKYGHPQVKQKVLTAKRNAGQEREVR